MILKVDFKKCVKAGECYYNHPGLFKMTESGFPAVVIREPASEQEIREAHEAIEVCPGGAISMEEEEKRGGPAAKAMPGRPFRR